MAYPTNARVPVQDRYWILGCNTLVSPTDIQQGAYYWSENIANRGGVIQTRPGKNLIFSLPGNRAQGIAIYRPFRQKEQLVWAVDGNVFYSIYPFTSYAQLPNVSFYQYSPIVTFCQARQGVQANLDGSLTVLPQPVDILMMQDGYTASAFYIASSSTGLLQSGHNKPAAPWYQCPTGLQMAYSGYRLWVCYDYLVYASDLFNPNSFTEQTYLAEASGFALPETCTGMLETPWADQLLCFTPFTITSLQSSITDRDSWQTTPNFQSIISKDYGSVSNFGCVNQFGLPWFFSEVGLVNLNEAMQAYRSSRINPQDMEMLRSKSNMSPDRSGICAVSFEDWLLYSVPSGSRFNRHTWIMDGAPQSQISQQAGPCWTGIWTGTYPVQYATGEIQDVPRCFEICYSCTPIKDSAGNSYQIHIFEDFCGRRTDNNNNYFDTPISCSFESRIFEVSQVGELSRFKYLEIDVVELVGDVAIQFYYAGIKAHYREMYTILLKAEEGSPGNTDTQASWAYQALATDTVFQTYKSQTRTVRTPDFSGNQFENDDCADTCPMESPYQLNIDKGFQILINWQGRMGIREMRIFVEPYPQPGVGACTQTEVGEVNVMSAIGCLPAPNVCLIPVP
jgi:hypothetical protein